MQVQVQENSATALLLLRLRPYSFAFSMAEFSGTTVSTGNGDHKLGGKYPPFYLAGNARPRIVSDEFSMNKCRAAKLQLVSGERKGSVQFGQPQGRPTVTLDKWNSTECLVGGAVSIDQTDSVETKNDYCLSHYGWKVQRGKVCIQADTLLCSGDQLDRKEWTDKFNFAFFQTLESSTQTFTYMDPDDETKRFEVTKKLIDDLCYPLLDVQTYLGNKYIPRSGRPWAPYYSSVSQMNLKGLVRFIEESQAEALSGCISLGDSPYICIAEELQVGSKSTSAEKHCCKLSTAEYYERYRSWVSVHDQCTGTVWPMVVFEWYFDFKAHTERNSLVLDVSTPNQPSPPTIFLNDDSEFKPIPQFPYKVLHKIGPCQNEYIAANDEGLYKPVVNIKEET